MPSTERATVPGMAEKIERRRRELHLSPGQLATAAGVTTAALAPVRKGVRKGYQDSVVFGVADALGWTVDWHEDMLAGRDPTIADPVAEILRLAAELPTETVREALRALQAAIEAAAPTPSDDPPAP